MIGPEAAEVCDVPHQAGACATNLTWRPKALEISNL